MKQRTSDILSVIVLLCGLLLTICLAIYRPEIHADADLGYDKTSNASTNDHDVADQGRPIKKLADAAVDDGSAHGHDETNDQKKEQLEINRAIASANRAMVIFTALLVAVSVVAAIIQFAAIRIAGRSADIANKSAEAAAESSKAATETMLATKQSAEAARATSRAYLYITKETVGLSGASISVTIEFENAGNTPASDVTFSGVLDAYSYEEVDKILPQLRPDRPISEPFLYPGKSGRIALIELNKTREARAALESRWPKPPLCAFGWIGYTDVFNDRHWLPFLYRIARFRRHKDSPEEIGIKKVRLKKYIAYSRDTEQSPLFEEIA